MGVAGNFTPAYRVTVGGAEVTGAFQDRLSEIRITDKTGIKSDRVTLTFDNRDKALGLPPMGSVLSVWLGYKESGLVYMGRYTVDRLTIFGPPDTMTIEGKAADMRSSLMAQKKRGWEETTLGALVAKIAGEHGLGAAVSPELAAQKIARIDQADESDMHFLTRLGQRFDAVAKPADGKLLFTKAATGRSASGQALGGVTITAQEIVKWSVEWSLRDDHEQIGAQFADDKEGGLKTVTVPKEGGAASGPTFTLRQNYPDKAAAETAAAAESAARNRARGDLSLTIIGRPTVGAESPITVVGVTQGISGKWIGTEVTHILMPNDGFITEIQCEPPGQKAGGDDDYDPVAAAKR